MQRYYKWHARIYDLTRWSFLFGRKRLIKKIPLLRQQQVHLLEVGCGTGVNLSFIRRYFFNSQLTGYDVSADMIRIAHARLRPDDDSRICLLEAPYQPGSNRHTASQDVVLFSYSLTMINPHWDNLIQQAYKDLKPGGFLAVVDFHDSAFPWFKRHMGKNHVRMDGHLLPALKALGLRPCVSEIRPAYAGLWHYMLFIGMKPAEQ
jgi:S-adenosylmethionine-diacylgycerolhomoserine-N-methlytransferase